jgi:hypothetical protein
MRFFLLCLRASVAIPFFSPTEISAQNLEKIGKKEMITISGGMNFNSIFYNAQGFAARRDPFTWYFNGNLNVNILDVSFPFTYSYSNLHGTYSEPFNMQSCSPKYKWIQGHAGTTSMNFSNYTLSGHVFTGGGIELTPKGFYFGAMYGRLNKAVEYDAATNSFANMSYKRMGYAVKIGFDKKGNSIGATYFSAKDDPASLLFVPPDANLFAAQNSAISFSGKTKLFGHFSAEGEIAFSGLTRNILSNSNSTGFSGLQKWLLPAKTTTQFFTAYKVSFGYTGNKISVNINHEHVDPDYQTFGAYYFNNDLDNWTIAPSFRLWKGKISIAANAGVQKNNLDQSKLNTTHRWVGSLNFNFSPSAAWMFNCANSNFTSFTNHHLQSDPFGETSPADTLSFYQISQQANANLVHSFGNKRIRQNISVMSSYQVTGSQQNLIVQPNTIILNGNIAYSLQIAKTKTSFSLIANYNRAITGILLTELFGPGLQFSQTILNGNVRISIGSTYNRSFTNEILTGNILSHRTQFNWSPKMKNSKIGKPALGINAVYVNRFPIIATQTKTGELTVMANLGWSF